MTTDLTKQQREDREKAIQEVCEENLHDYPENSFDDAWILKCYPASIALHERAIRFERERGEAYTALDNIRDAVLNERYQLEGSGCTNYQINDVLGIIDDNDPRVALPANGGQHND